jgi:hypothetical protein
VIEEVSSRILQPDRLRLLLEAYLKSTASRADETKERLSQMRQSHKEAEAAIMRLLELVEKGLMEAEDPSLKERLIGLKVRRDELTQDIGDLQKRVTSGEPVVTPAKIEKLAALLRDELHNGPPELRQAYARLAMREVSVKNKDIRITGWKAVLAKAAARVSTLSRPEFSFVREWRAPANFDRTASSRFWRNGTKRLARLALH